MCVCVCIEVETFQIYLATHGAFFMKMAVLEHSLDDSPYKHIYSGQSVTHVFVILTRHFGTV